MSVNVETTPLRLTRRGKALVWIVTIAAGIGIGLAVEVHGPCDPVDVSNTAVVSDEERRELLNTGWTGSATDGMEALYAPGCV